LDTSGIILAGGKGLRLGRRDKTTEIINHRRLLERVAATINFLEQLIIVISDSKKTLPELKGIPAPKVVTDVYPGKGPLGGIYSGIRASGSQFNLIVGCDMPFLNQGLLRYLLEVADGYDAVTIRHGDNVEPLHAVYARSCLEPIGMMLEKDNLCIYELFETINVRYVEAREIERFDPEHLSLFNINNFRDLELARKISHERET